MISKTESGRVGYQKKYWVAGRVRVPAGHCIRGAPGDQGGASRGSQGVKGASVASQGINDDI